MYNTYVPNKTISLPDDVIPLIESLGIPFSQWVAEQLRLHAASHLQLSLADQLRRDAELAGEHRPTPAQTRAALARMDRTAPW